MRSVTIAEVEKDLAKVLDSAKREPVRILHEGDDLIVVSASQFEDAQEKLRKQRAEALVQAMERCSEEARKNGFTDDMLPDLLRR
jgi:PHD/YefM family antitoxin component YafN of YafNO toxin-antitoxin module